jgi:DNA segregation ATPase FtsK/SpoIIIE, S-DNA-T family
MDRKAGAEAEGVRLPFGTVERGLRDGYVRLSRSAASARRYADGAHYRGGAVTGTVSDQVAEIVAAYPWALGGFGDPAWKSFRPDAGAPAPEGVRVGTLRTAGVGGPLPAVVPFAKHGHLLITEDGSGQAARSLLQAVVLRLATATAPGTVRFALADAAGQGRYLSAFLRLPAQLRAGDGVAASPEEIEDLLGELTRHVVEVTQTRLTNVYDSVEAYNATTAGNLVPYHVLALAGYPAGITDRAAELLARLARNGPRAGVYVVATVEPLPDFAANATILSPGRDGDLTWHDPENGLTTLVPDQMPPAARANPWLDAVGVAAGAAIRDVPFSAIAVGPARWDGCTADGLDVTIGIDSTGVNRHFVLGVRGVHHGLVGGDVRMGKTNLLHVLISQLALKYPPEELELYLLDFKEVEFDAYLSERLPHARAIASRTDREFGLSMLRRFHDEIERRARLCREAKVTDLADYRRETGLPLPRALVIMDEFQVLFSLEDRLAREAAHLLADIAKRGAAFGLHLLLATQSPGGALTAYLRPVYEQMALRIALGCTQPSVSQAILGEGNIAATRLTLAGAAICSDRRGEGTSVVTRIAVLPTRKRLDLIASIRELAGDRDYPQPVSFDPVSPALFSSVSAAPAGHGQVDAWLGEALEIKPPTCATFERYPRSNLLVVGGEEYGYRLLLATVLSAAVQCPPDDVRFTIAEFARPSSGFYRFFDVLSGLPHPVRIADRSTADGELDRLLTELDSRLAGAGSGPAEFFLIAGMHRWHELTAEGDYGRPSETSARLGWLASQGPEAGLHVVAWADGYATAERVLRRAGIASFGLRAVLRVSSPAESEALLGMPAAASLDDDRALFRDTDWPAEQAEKFKPYSLASLRTFAARAFAPDAFGSAP